MFPSSLSYSMFGANWQMAASLTCNERSELIAKSSTVRVESCFNWFVQHTQRTARSRSAATFVMMHLQLHKKKVV